MRSFVVFVGNGVILQCNYNDNDLIGLKGKRICVPGITGRAQPSTFLGTTEITFSAAQSPVCRSNRETRVYSTFK